MKSLILIFIALGCGLVASIGISQVMDRGGGGGNVEMEQILVALADIDIGSKLDAQNVKLEDWPKAKVPEGAVRRLEDVKEKFANSRFFKGEPIHTSRITDNLKSVANSVPEGFRAMPVKVDEDTVMKAISPGDRVDVMVFLRKNEEIPETGVFTILKNVRVFAVNTNTERNNEASGKNETANFRTVSLLVTPDQSRDLAVAAQIGKILLTLRRADEQDDKSGEEATNINLLLGGHPKIASDPLKQGSTIPQFSTPKHGSSSAPANPPEFFMELWTPTSMEQFNWYDR
ncbi:MAG TPA: Flp pilus assembly protein CpaB, partial [Pirellulaceae bacterium]|nr:Flp pilus assembly protein CpaB [Pirellulaceae bacterium]